MPPARNASQRQAGSDDLDAPLSSSIFPTGMTSSRGRKVKPRTWDTDEGPEPEAMPAATSKTPPTARKQAAPVWRPPSPVLSSSDDTRSEDEEEDAAYAQASSQRLR